MSDRVSERVTERAKSATLRKFQQVEIAKLTQSDQKNIIANKEDHYLGCLQEGWRHPMCILCIINLKYSGHQEYVSSVCTSAQDLKINSNLGAQATAIISIQMYV